MTDEKERLDTIERLLEELEGFAQKSSFWLPHKIIIPDQEFFRICMELREAIPSVLKEAREIVEQRDNYIENAKREHRRILETAESRVRDLVSEEAVVREAQYEVDRIIGNANEEATELKREALLYTDDLLAKLSESFAQTLDTVNNGRKLIKHFLEENRTESTVAGDELKEEL
jgi:cell division septum initiation protein DivIVA